MRHGGDLLQECILRPAEEHYTTLCMECTCTGIR